MQGFLTCVGLGCPVISIANGEYNQKWTARYHRNLKSWTRTCSLLPSFNIHSITTLVLEHWQNVSLEVVAACTNLVEIHLNYVELVGPTGDTAMILPQEPRLRHLVTCFARPSHLATRILDGWKRYLDFCRLQTHGICLDGLPDIQFEQWIIDVAGGSLKSLSLYRKSDCKTVSSNWPIISYVSHSDCLRETKDWVKHCLWSTKSLWAEHTENWVSFPMSISFLLFAHLRQFQRKNSLHSFFFLYRHSTRYPPAKSPRMRIHNDCRLAEIPFRGYSNKSREVVWCFHSFRLPVLSWFACRGCRRHLDEIFHREQLQVTYSELTHQERLPFCFSESANLQS